MNGTGSSTPRDGGTAHGPERTCPSDLALDAWLTGHLEAGERDAVETAIAECDDCRARADSLRMQRETFLESPAAERFETRLLARARERAARPSLWHRWRVALGGFGAAAAAAAAVLLFVVTPTETPTETPGGVAVKGGPINVETFVRRDGAVLRLGAGDEVQPGDAVGFRATATRDGWLAVFGTGRDTTGSLSSVAIVPRTGVQAFAVTAGETTQLPASALLDAAGDEERFAVVVCPSSFSVAAARDALASWAKTGDDGDAAEAVRDALAPDCDLRLLTFPKP